MPQLLVNVPVADRTQLAGATAVWDEVRAFERELGDEGRVVVRPSGTEPLVRVMVEARTADECESWCTRIAVAAAHALGSPAAEAASAGR
jgi:phosphoglucosamine mutase